MLHTISSTSDSSCRYCGAADSNYLLLTKWHDGKQYLVAQTPLCGNKCCEQSLKSVMADRITGVLGDSVCITFNVEDNNDDPF